MTLGKMSLDPDSIGKNPLIDQDFRVEVHFKDVCTKRCKPDEPINKKCNFCQQIMDDDI